MTNKVGVFFPATYPDIFCSIALCVAEEEKQKSEDPQDAPKVDDDIGKSRDASRTDDETVQKEEEAIKLDGLNVAQMKEIREKAEKHEFQAEVSRMMKLIINSLYRNKEVIKKMNLVFPLYSSIKQKLVQHFDLPDLTFGLMQA